MSKYEWTEQNTKNSGSQSKVFLDTCSAVSASSDSSQRSRVRFPLPLRDFIIFILAKAWSGGTLRLQLVTPYGTGASNV